MEWTQIVTALSTAVLAVLGLGVAVAAIPALRQAARAIAALERLTTTLDRETRPLIDTTRTVVADAGRLTDRIRREIDGVLDTSQDIRERVVSAVDAAEDRLLDLEALLDVIQAEVEDTALDVAAALRTSRRGAALLGTMKRTFLGSGKKRKRRR